MFRLLRTIKTKKRGRRAKKRKEKGEATILLLSGATPITKACTVTLRYVHSAILLPEKEKGIIQLLNFDRMRQKGNALVLPPEIRGKFSTRGSRIVSGDVCLLVRPITGYLLENIANLHRVLMVALRGHTLF